MKIAVRSFRDSNLEILAKEGTLPNAPAGRSHLVNISRTIFSALSRAVFAAVLWMALNGSCLAGLINFEAAAKYSRKTGGRLLMVWKDGSTQHDDPALGFTSETPTNVFSITKTITALAWLARADFSVGNHFPGWAADPLRNGVTLGSLLSQTSGISPGYERLYSRNVRSVRSSASLLPIVHTPGTAFQYGPSHYELLGAWADPNPDGPDAAKLLLERNLLNRMGIHPPGWRTDGKGKIYLSAGVFLSGNDLLKLGRLVLDGGQLNSLSRIVPSQNLRLALTGSTANPAYGFGFWLNSRSVAKDARERDVEAAIAGDLSGAEWQRTCLSRSAPPDMVSMVGSGGQRVYVVPSWHMVIVRLGLPGGFKDPDFFRALTTGL